MTSVSDLKAKFENPNKVSEIKAKLEKSSSSSNLVKVPSNSNLVKPPTRTNSASKLEIKLQPIKVETKVEQKGVASTSTTSKSTSTTPKSKSPEVSPTVIITDEKKFFPEEKETPVKVIVEERKQEPIKQVQVDLPVVEPVKVASPTARLFSAADAAIPPTVEEQDYMVLWILSFIIPFFLLRFVFEFTRKFILTPTRLGFRYAPGGNKFLGFLYSKLGPIIVVVLGSLKDKLPPMDSVGTVARSGLEKFIATMQVAAGAAYPHLLHLGESMTKMKFREAAGELFSVLRAWAPMLLLIIPAIKNTVVILHQVSSSFLSFSKTAFYLPFGRFLRGAVQNFGKALSENPDVFAERMASLLGPIVFSFVSIILVTGFLLQIGMIDYSTLSSFYVAWFFRLLGMVSEPSILDNHADLLSSPLQLDASTAGAAAAAEVGNTATTGSASGGFSW